MTPDPQGPPSVVLVVPDDLSRPTGGNRYDQRLAEAIRRLGVHVEERGVPGAWPVGDTAAQHLLAQALTAVDPADAGGADAGAPGRSPRPVLVDGLLACGVPEAVEAAVAGGTPVHVLVHMPLGARTDLTPGHAAELDARERRALRAATSVVATSRFSAADLQARHGLAEAGVRVAVAVPGARPGVRVPGADCRGLLRQLATISPVKDQLTVVEALALIRQQDPGLAWTCELTGLLDVDPGYTEQVRSAIHRHGLADRVRLTGPLDGPELEEAWEHTDLLLLPSRTETWGLVVTEALARGIPAVVSRGTGAQEALGDTEDGLPGALVPPGDPVALADAVRHLLGPGWTGAVVAAATRLGQLPWWSDTAADVLQALGVEQPPPADPPFSERIPR